MHWPPFCFFPATSLFSKLPGTSAIFGLSCSDDVQATLAWLARHNKSAAVVSSESRAPHLADDTAYPNLARFTPNEQALLTALYCVQWGISRLCVRVRPVSRDGSAGTHAHKVLKTAHLCCITVAGTCLTTG